MVRRNQQLPLEVLNIPFDPNPKQQAKQRAVRKIMPFSLGHGGVNRCRKKNTIWQAKKTYASA